uniref:F-box domain-containing protein n=1 Tax=Parastrongyloides trichosuri TaxID=131310 RepID=A0A0N4ZNV2_PARTI
MGQNCSSCLLCRRKCKDKEEKITSIEIVFNSSDLTSLILDYLTDHRDRKNFELVCRQFYHYSKNKINYTSKMFHECKFKELIYVCTNVNYNSKFYFSDNTLIVRLDASPSFQRYGKVIYKRKIEHLLLGMEGLFFEGLVHEHMNILKGFKCPSRIKYLSLNTPLYYGNPLEIFKYVKTLKPHTLIFDIHELERTHYNFLQLFSRLIPRNEVILIPKSVKNIHLRHIDSKFLKFLVEGLTNFGEKELDNLEVKLIHSKIYYSNPSDRYYFMKFISYFKNVHISMINNFVYDINTPMGRFLNECNNISNLNIRLHLNLYEDIFLNPERSVRSRTSLIFCQVSDLFLNISKLVVDKTNTFPPFNDKEMDNLCLNLIRMKKLHTMCIDFEFIKSLNFFERFVSSLNKSVVRIKINRCSKMRWNHLLLLSKYCQQITCLSLKGIKSRQIRIKDILNRFGNLYLLDMKYAPSYKFSIILKDLTLKIKETDKYKLKWPNILVLCIFCPEVTNDQKNFLQSVIENTPRKCGQAVIFNEAFSNEKLKFVMQKCSGCYNNFYSTGEKYYTF